MDNSIENRQHQANVPVDNDSVEQELRIRLICTRDNRAAVSRVAREQGWMVMEFAREKGSLENIFRELTRADQTGESGKQRKRRKR